VVSC